MNVLNEYRSRIEWLEEARQKVEAGEWQPVVVERVLQRFLKTPVRSAVLYCDIDSECGYSDTGEHEFEVKRARAKYLAAIASLEATITKRREGEKYRVILEALEAVKGQHKDQVTPQGEQNAKAQPVEYPKELDTDLARYVFGCFVERGTIEEDGEFYKWKGTYLEYAVFVAAGCVLFGLKKKNRKVWKPFNIAFQRTSKQVQLSRSDFSEHIGDKDVFTLKYIERGGSLVYDFMEYVERWKMENGKNNY